MSGSSNRSSNGSEWVILTPRGNDDSDRDEEPEVGKFLGGTQDPSPATNPRPRPPRQRLSGLDGDSGQAAGDWYSEPSGLPISSEWRRESSSYGLPEYPSSASSTARQSASYWERDSSDRPSLYEQRRRSSTHRLVDDSRWYTSGEPADFLHRTIVPQYHYAESGQQYAPVSQTSDLSSMAMTGESRSTYYSSLASSRAPPLISSWSTRRDSESSARTDSIALGPNYYGLEEYDDLIPHAPESRRRTLQCPWSPLGCDEWFDNPMEWETHYQAHFRGRLPRSIECPFRGCNDTFQGERSRDAWRERWSHIISCQHRMSGVKPRLSRSLIDHLWRKGLISTTEEQALRQTGTLSTAEADLESYSGSRDRRRERRPDEYRSPRAGGVGSGGSYLPRR